MSDSRHCNDSGYPFISGSRSCPVQEVHNWVIGTVDGVIFAVSFGIVVRPQHGDVMKFKGTSRLYICIILTGLALICISSAFCQESKSNIERYIRTLQYKVPVWRDGQWKKQLRFLSIPYDSRGRVPFLQGFEGHCDAIGIGDWKHPLTLEKDVHIFVIHWPANMTDGDLALTVLPNFIYLRTSHNNPNPDFFLWYRYISEPQYAALARFFEESVKNGTLSLDVKSEPDSANWTPAYVENLSISNGKNEGWRLYSAISNHFISANVNYLFDQAN